MGVPKLYQFLLDRYPLIAHLASTFPSATFTHFYIDLNGILHKALHSDSGQVVKVPILLSCEFIAIERARNILQCFWIHRNTGGSCKAFPITLHRHRRCCSKSKGEEAAKFAIVITNTKDIQLFNGLQMNQQRQRRYKKAKQQEEEGQADSVEEKLSIFF